MMKSFFMERDLTAKIWLIKAVSLSLFLGLSGSSFAASDDLNREFDVSPGGKLEVISDSGAIEVNTWNQDRVQVHIRNGGRYDADALTLTVEQSGADVFVRADVNRRSVNIKFSITVPREYDLDLHTGGGAIEIDDITGEVNAETSGGRIRIGDITGEVNAETSGGSIRIGNVSDGSANADTSGGSITIGNVDGDVEADTAGGSINVGDVGGSGTMDTAGGGIEVGLVQGPVVVDTSGGSIRLQGSETSVRARTSGGNITVERSAGPVEVSTSGGNITIEDAAGAIDAKTSGGRIEATLSASVSDAPIDLESSGGEISITIPANHNATISADLRLSRRARGDYRIYTDFPLTIQDEDDRRIVARGDINGGGDRIRLRTSNGDINILSLDN